METQFGHDFTRVRVHTGARAAESARSVGAHAYAVGPDIVFGAGRYQPWSTAGRGLLAHELAHFVQEPTPSAPGSNLLVGRADDPVERRAAAAAQAIGAGSPRPLALGRSQRANRLRRQPAAQAPAAPAPPQQGGFVERILVECKDADDRERGHAEGTVKMITAGNTYIFDMKRCRIPAGHYDATVIHAGRWAKIKLHTGESLEVDITRAQHEKGFRSPAELLAGQDQVSVDVRPREIAMEVETATASHDPTECLLPKDDQDVVDKHDLTYPLFDHTFPTVSLWTQKLPLGLFGLVDFTLEAGGSAKAGTDGFYGPGTLHDICMLKVLDNPKNTLEGHAKFTFPARLDLSVDLDGWLKLDGELKAGYLVGVSLGNLGGTLGVHGNVALDLLLDADARILLDLATHRFTLAGAAHADAVVSFTLGVDAEVYLSLLGFKLWSAAWHWQPVDETLDWHAGMTIDKDLGVSFDSDQAQMAASASSRRGRSRKTNIGDFVNAASEIADEITSAIVAARTGTLGDRRRTVDRPDGSEDRPMPFIWCKPGRTGYPSTMSIPDAVEPKVLNRDDGPRDVNVPVSGTPRVVSYTFGVDKGYWPKEGQVFLYKWNPNPPRNAQRLFRTTTARAGFAWQGYEPDHVRDVQFGDGLDNPVNLWPLDETKNASAGPSHQHQLENTGKSLGRRDGYYIFIDDISG